MENKMTDEILKRLDLLATKLSTTVDHLWHVLILQARVEAISDILGMGIAIFAGWLMFKWIKYINENSIDDIVYVPVVFISIGIIITFWVCVSNIPTELFNPEYFALHKILESLK